MSFNRDWHVPIDRLAAYAGGTSTSTERASVETHLIACEQCRVDLSGARPATRLAPDASLAAIFERIDRPRRPFHKRTGVLQVSLASPALMAASALLAAALLAAVGLASAIEASLGFAVLVAVAPLVPAAAASVAFWPATDPAGSLAAATPLAAGLLPFMRALFRLRWPSLPV